MESVRFFCTKVVRKTLRMQKASFKQILLTDFTCNYCEYNVNYVLTNHV